MPTTIDHHRFKGTGTLKDEGAKSIRGSRTVIKNGATNSSHNSAKNVKSTMPKVFSSFRPSTAPSTASSSNNNKPQPTQTTITKTTSCGDISSNTGSSGGNGGWARRYNDMSNTTGTTIDTTRNDSDDLNQTDDTEDSSNSGGGMVEHQSPIITESSYVYPTTAATATDHNPPPTCKQSDNVDVDEVPHTWSSSNINASSNASTKAVHKPVTEILWESAEPFIAYSSAQGAKWCLGMNQLSMLLEETCTETCTGGISPRQQRQQQQQDFDDSFAIVGTQDEDDEVANGNVTTKNAMSSPFNVDATTLCGKDGAPPMQLPCGQSSNAQAAAGDVDTTNRTNSAQQQRRIVISRTHEDIEVSPGHHVQVRLPPTNPILKSSSAATTSPPRSSTIKNSGHLPPSPGLQRIHVAVNSSNDSCKAVPLVPKDVVTDPIHKNIPKNDIGVSTTEGVTGTLPVVSFEVKPEEALELERSISELTMRSSYAATDSALQKIPENRRMAYYAVGKHHRQSGRGGNRRCYFSGKLILGGTPFYAGSVLQGLRTLVVFCLPSSVGLPDKESMMVLNIPRQPQLSLANRSDSHSTGTATLRGLRLLKSATNGSGSKQSSPSYISHYTQHSNNLGAGASHTGSTIKSSGILSNRSSNRSLQQNQHRSSNNNANCGASTAGSKSMMSRLSSLDDLSLSVEGDLDPNWSLDRDMLLKILPPASPDLLKAMSTLYPEQFETLPVQVRDSKQWKLYVKFCFFSGLPISDGEMHYKVRDDIAEQVYGEEIVLSHDVMEASTGASAEILTLPNRTVMRYLRKHYAQQCSKLDDRVFQRASWERVAPEV